MARQHGGNPCNILTLRAVRLGEDDVFDFFCS
jgi:hypothetical protein